MDRSTLAWQLQRSLAGPTHSQSLYYHAFLSVFTSRQKYLYIVFTNANPTSISPCTLKSYTGFSGRRRFVLFTAPKRGNCCKLRLPPEFLPPQSAFVPLEFACNQPLVHLVYSRTHAQQSTRHIPSSTTGQRTDPNGKVIRTHYVSRIQKSGPNCFGRHAHIYGYKRNVHTYWSPSFESQHRLAEVEISIILNSSQRPAGENPTSSAIPRKD